MLDVIESTIGTAAVLKIRTGAAPANVATVPVVGKVNAVLLVVVNVVVCAPDVVKFPPNVMVLPVLATPVPPYCPATTVPIHVPPA